MLEGKIALVTGGGAGIGRAACEAFAEQGATEVIAEINAERAADTAATIQGAGGVATHRVVDVRDRLEVEELASWVAIEAGPVDILVNNVGDFLRPGRPFLETNEDHWQQIFEVNLATAFLCTQAFAPTMIKRNSGSIINVSTIEAFRGIPGQVAYSAFNAAIDGFTRSFALEVAHHGVRVNCIAPDVIDTPATDYAARVPAGAKEHIPSWVPIGRFGQPKDAAGVLLFLASDLSKFVTGTTLHVDGGTYAAGGWHRMMDGQWTNSPVISDSGKRRGSSRRSPN